MIKVMTLVMIKVMPRWQLYGNETASTMCFVEVAPMLGAEMTHSPDFKLFEWSKHVGIFHFTGAFKIFSFLKSKTCWWNQLLNQCCLWNLYAPRNQMMCRVNYFIVVHSNSENMIVTYHLACHHKNRSLFFFINKSRSLEMHKELLCIK